MTATLRIAFMGLESDGHLSKRWNGFVGMVDEFQPTAWRVVRTFVRGTFETMENRPGGKWHKGEVAFLPAWREMRQYMAGAYLEYKFEADDFITRLHVAEGDTFDAMLEYDTDSIQAVQS